MAKNKGNEIRWSSQGSPCAYRYFDNNKSQRTQYEISNSLLNVNG